MSEPTLLRDELLLEQFNRSDFERAKTALLQRYHLWNGLLVSADERSVLTPDDLAHLRVQAAELLEQDVRSVQEQEQLKILTVLIYLLMDADKAALPGGDEAIGAQWARRPPHADHYILRRLVHGSRELDWADIERLVQYENRVLASYITNVPAGEDGDEGVVLEGLQSRDGVVFDLIDGPYELKLRRRDAAAAKAAAAAAAPPPVRIVPRPLAFEAEPLVLRDGQVPFLVQTVRSTRLACGRVATVACYIGRERKQNEDGVVVVPAVDQVVVIDAMGGYGNGLAARDAFVDAVLEHPGDIEAAVATARRRYDELGLDQGGVCLIAAAIEALSDDGARIELAQAGDVHAVLLDENGEIVYETMDEAIGHQVINAVIGEEATRAQRENGWQTFGVLTRAVLRARPGYRLAIYSDGLANHFDAAAMRAMLAGRSSKQAIADLSIAVDEAMRREKAYRDNCSIAIIDF
ncbi:MAG: hypothetical protein KatS3mg121_0239 [Gammaproteobacteria bacterium]|nr:MAG: hypothetical protein KatS3mg121_0239 [Gammaproteobacteria bacterium]